MSTAAWYRFSLDADTFCGVCDELMVLGTCVNERGEKVSLMGREIIINVVVLVFNGFHKLLDLIELIKFMVAEKRKFLVK